MRTQTKIIINSIVFLVWAYNMWKTANPNVEIFPNVWESSWMLDH